MDPNQIFREATNRRIVTWCLDLLDNNLTLYDRLKQAAADPSNLTQEKIIRNLDGVERERLNRIRNIGIAVGLLYC